MNKVVYRYRFHPRVPVQEIEASLLLALLATEGLHGESQVRLDAAHYFDRDHHACVIEADTPVGRDINRLFVSFMRREFGEDAFTVERVDSVPVSDESVTNS